MTGMNDPLGSFIAEVESGAGLQEPDAAAVRYERLCTEEIGRASCRERV